MAALPIVDDAPPFLAIKEGFFTQAGLNVVVKSVAQSTVAIPDLLHGSIDVIGGGNYVSFLEAQAHGTFPVEFLAPAVDCTTNNYGVVAMPSSGHHQGVGPGGQDDRGEPDPEHPDADHQRGADRPTGSTPARSSTCRSRSPTWSRR